MKRARWSVSLPLTLCASLALASCDADSQRAALDRTVDAAAETAKGGSAQTVEPQSVRSEAKKREALAGIAYGDGVARVDLAEAKHLVQGPDAKASAEALAESRTRLSENRNWDAISAGTRAVLLAPQDVTAWDNLARALLAKGLASEARAAFRAALELAPNDVELRAGLADATVRVGDRETAIADLRAVLELAPEHAFARERLALQLFYTGQVEAAWSEVHAIEAQGRSVPAQFRDLLSKAMAEPR